MNKKLLFRRKVIDLIAPMIVMIFTAIATMIWTGYLNGGTNLVEDFANCSCLVMSASERLKFTPKLMLNSRGRLSRQQAGKLYRLRKLFGKMMKI